VIEPDLSPLSSASPEDVAKALHDEAMMGGPDEFGCDDPITWVLWWEMKRWMLGQCAPLAMHLSATRGYPIAIIECAPEGSRQWGLRHAAVTTLPEAEAAALIEQGRGFDLPIIDAAGTGTLQDRMELYWAQGHDFRVTLTANPECVLRRLLEDRPAIQKWDGDQRDGRIPDLEHVIPRLPGLSLALGAPFEIKEAVETILMDETLRGRTLAGEVEASGITEWARGTPVPAS